MLAFKFDRTPLIDVRAVVPANVDIATQEIIQMAEDADPHGQRTLGVLTKPDLVDKGAEDRVRVAREPMRLVTNTFLGLGACYKYEGQRPI
jgi:hypothetical protein